MEERQKEYEEWQKEMAEQIGDRFDIQTGKMDSLQDTVSTMGENLKMVMDTLGSLASSMVSQEKLNKETSRFAALNSGMHMDMTML
eukprot:7063020-Ditylum_brightwellii.AAC.1